jgi:FtsH-binding integral membrane protein
MRAHPGSDKHAAMGTGTTSMTDEKRQFFLRIALIAAGLACFGLYPLSIVWPSGWAWGHGHSHYFMMIVGLYVTLGVFLLVASRNPDAHRSLIWFAIWSSVVHAAIMGVQSLSDPMERGHLIADVPALAIIAIVLAALMRRTKQG